MTPTESGKKASPEAMARANKLYAKNQMMSGICRDDIAAELDAACAEAVTGLVHKGYVDEAYFKGWNAARRRAVEIAESEGELDGPIPSDNLEATLRNPESSLRAAVRVTKMNIAAALERMEPTTEGKP